MQNPQNPGSLPLNVCVACFQILSEPTTIRLFLRALAMMTSRCLVLASGLHEQVQGCTLLRLASPYTCKDTVYKQAQSVWYKHAFIICCILHVQYNNYLPAGTSRPRTKVPICLLDENLRIPHHVDKALHDIRRGDAGTVFAQLLGTILKTLQDRVLLLISVLHDMQQSF